MKNLAIAFVLAVFTQVSYAQKTLLKNVSVITMTKESIDKQQDILIDNGKITQIGRDLKAKGATVVDGTGKYVIPGLMDMHSHLYYEQGKNVDTSADELKLMLANGITTVRIANGDPLFLDIRKKANSKQLTGPEMFVASPSFAGSWPEGTRVFAHIVKTPEEAIAAVKKSKADGYDAIKIVMNVRPEVYDAIAQEAARQNIPIFGHVGPYVKLPQSLKYKQQNEHMDEFIEMLLPDSTINGGQSVSDLGLWRAKSWATVPQLDESKIPALIQKVRESGIYVTPTNYFFNSFAGKTINADFATTNPEFAYVPSILKEEAWDIRQRYIDRLPSQEDRDKYMRIRATMIREMWKSGVPLMAGSDSPQWFNVTGFAIHNELENLVECGLTPYAVLQTATVNPSRYMKIDNRKGTIAVGMEADMVLLDQDPLADIHNARKISGIFRAGKFYNAKDVKQLLEDAKKLGQ